MTPRRTFLLGSIIAGILLGTWAVTRYAPAAEGAAIGKKLPEFRTLNLAKGDSVGLRSDYKGHVTLINLWATYCVPCKVEMPSIQHLYDTYKDRGFKVAALSLDEGDSAPVLAYTKSLGLTFDILQDRSGVSLQTLRGVGLPFSILVDANGKVITMSLGAEQWDSPALVAKVDTLLKAAQ